MYKDIKRELNFLRVVSKIVKFLSAGFKTNRQQRLLSRIPERIACKDPPHSDWAENIIFAGSTAFLLLIVNIFPAYWYFSFFALTPFLYKTIKSTPEDSSRLGFLLGFLFFSVSLSESLVLSPLTASIKLISGTALIAIFGWTVGWTRKRWGFNPLVIALLWVGFELGLVKFGFDFGLFGKTTFTHSLFGSVILLIGFITISFVIVLSNSLLVLL
ncbi:MAG: hypothetical protein GY855_07715, partial [candidate division Zixibacteria bacterium]|nr:hypothetical protein [candidate division Zixibacteria bacterium]